MAKTAADVLKMAKDNEVKFVDFRFHRYQRQGTACNRTCFCI